MRDTHRKAAGGTNRRHAPIVLPPNITKKAMTRRDAGHSERALEYSDHAYKLAQEAHAKWQDRDSLNYVHSI